MVQLQVTIEPSIACNLQLATTLVWFQQNMNYLDGLKRDSWFHEDRRSKPWSDRKYELH